LHEVILHASFQHYEQLGTGTASASCYYVCRPLASIYMHYYISTEPGCWASKPRDSIPYTSHAWTHQFH